MASVTTAHGGTGNGVYVIIKPGRSYTYTVTGGATATVAIQTSDNGGTSWTTVVSSSSNIAPVTVLNTTGKKLWLRSSCTAYTSGTATATVKDATEELAGVGSSSTSGVTVYEYHENGPIRRTVLECNAVTVTISDDAGVAQYGGVKVYDFPEGMLLTLGAQVSGILTAGVTGTIINNWDGDVALGTATATTGATLVSTEADILQSVAVSAGASDKLGVVDAVSVATALTETGARWHDGTATAKDMYLNFVIDDDATHTAGTATFTGTINILWATLGDN